jgi:xylulokinase
MAVIVIDLGTTGCKAALFDGDQMLGSAYHHFTYSSPMDGWAEQDAETVWELVDSTVRQAIGECRPEPEVEAIAVSVQGDAIIPINSQGRALHPAILGMDIRSAPQAAELEERFGRGHLYAATGMPCEPLNSITKIAWLAHHHPELKSSIWKYAHYEDFLLMKLAGVPALDYTMASRTMAFDPARKDWVPGILEAVGITPSQLGNLSASGAPVGIVLRPVADAWGISRNALVITGGHDQCMAAVGAGVIEPDLACYSMGTAEVISTCFATPRATAAMLEANYPSYCHAVPGHYFTITLNQSGGLSLEWFQNQVMGLDELAPTVQSVAKRQLLDEVEIKPSLVMFLPHLVGSGTPTCDHLSRGTFLGLSLRTGRREMFQAVVEALAFEARLNLESLERQDIYVSELRGVGGGTRSRRILELKATVLNRPIRTLQNPEAALLGTAILAQVAMGKFRSIEEACRECVRIDQTIEPVRSAVDEYTAAFGRFRQVHGTLRSFYHNWRAECPVAALA